MNVNTINAEIDLNVTLQEALESGKIHVRVTDNRDPPRPIEGAQVEVMDGPTVIPGVTDANGEIILEIDFSGLPLFTAKPVTVVASQAGFTPSEQTATVIAVATIDVNLALVQLPQ
jgi:hypothetical protein